MKFNSLILREIRGIRQFDRTPQGKNIVICGENGTGKSGLVDSVDFLLTGKMRRLSGDGSKDLSLDEHGKHISAKLEDAYVEAELTVGTTGKVKLKRTIKSKKLEITGGSVIETAILGDNLKDGQFALTRKELLRFIACDGSTRAQQVQSLLDIQDIDKIRTSLNQAVTYLEKKELELDAVCTSNEQQIDNTLGLKKGNWNDRLGKLNQFRAALGAKEISELKDESDFVDGITKTATEKSVKKDDIERLLKNTDPRVHDSTVDYEDAKKLIETVKVRTAVFEEVKSLALVEMGLKLIAGNYCPLCDKEWKLEDLRTHLKDKEKRAIEAKEFKVKLDQLVSKSKGAITAQTAAIEKLKVSLDVAQKKDLVAELQKSILSLQRNEQVLETLDIDKLQSLISNKNLLLNMSQEGWSTSLSQFISTLPKEDNRDTAFNVLSQVKQTYRVFVEKKSELLKIKERLTIANLIRQRFDNARISYLDSLYKDIQGDFSEFYSIVNPEDEGEFPVELKPDGAALKLSVGFYDQGMHPPNALHSEGHQDMMGVCLYLALMKRLKSDKFTFCMLDDVMMSIDVDHRRKLCGLLNTKFKDTQFFITTHDRFWAEQLREVGVTDRNNLLFFRSWSLEHGPIFDNKDVWESLLERSKTSEVVESGGGLRRICEQEFSEIASNLRAKLIYRSSQSWTLGDYRPAAHSEFLKLLKKAKEAAESWDAKNNIEKIDSALTKLKKAEEDSRINWQTNKAIHFSNWGTLTKGEISDTVAAMHDLVNCYRCSDCKSPITTNIPADKFEPTSLGCTCGNFNLTLVKQ